MPADVGAAVGALAAAVRATPLERWTAADPYLALLVHRAVLDAQAAVEEDARDALRIALERLSHALAALGEAEEVGDARTPKELARWLADAVEVPQRDLADLLGRRPAPLPALDLAARADAARGRGRAPAARAGAASSASCGTRSRPRAWSRGSTGRGPELGGATPRELLGDPVRLPDLLLAAGSTRSTAFA